MKHVLEIIYSYSQKYNPLDVHLKGKGSGKKNQAGYMFESE